MNQFQRRILYLACFGLSFLFSWKQLNPWVEQQAPGGIYLLLIAFGGTMILTVVGIIVWAADGPSFLSLYVVPGLGLGFLPQAYQYSGWLAAALVPALALAIILSWAIFIAVIIAFLSAGYRSTDQESFIHVR